jgi:hypothetical protein
MRAPGQLQQARIGLRPEQVRASCPTASPSSGPSSRVCAPISARLSIAARSSARTWPSRKDTSHMTGRWAKRSGSVRSAVRLPPSAQCISSMQTRSGNASAASSSKDPSSSSSQ